MGEIWRSEEMQQVRLFVQIEAARDTVDELGKLGLVQFRDLNPDINAFQRTFVSEVKRFDEMERKVRYFEEQVTKSNIDRNSLATTQVETVGNETTSKVMIDDLEAKFDEIEKELIQMNADEEKQDRNQVELVELQNVLEKDSWFFDESDIHQAKQDETQLGGDGEAAANERSPLIDNRQTNATKAINLGFLTGVILRDKLPAFERVLWRATRGNMFIKQAAIDASFRDSHTNEESLKNVFIIFFQGARAQVKIKKICESFGAHLYPCPDSAKERDELRIQVRTRLADLRVISQFSLERKNRVILRLAANIKYWKAIVIKEKSIYHSMNMFNYDVGRKCLIAEGWCPTGATEDVQLALRKATMRSDAAVPSIISTVETNDTPPTYHKRNKFTASFQDIVDAYGIARYREVNPAVFALITFPFLFGVMFGDVGHGFFLTLVALFLILREKQLASQPLNEMIEMLFGGRYIVLLMGIFAMYCGAIYNETFNISASIFPSPYKFDEGAITPTFTRNTPAYWFGVDPNWKNAENELYFYNSLKMKTSIILGVSQMMLGIVLSAFNAVYYKKMENILFEFIPQVIFMMCTFGYMCFLIILKWCTDWSVAPTTERSRDAPSILNGMINMFLSPGGVRPPQNPNDIDFRFYPHQNVVQLILVGLALVSVPVMLVGKPIVLYLRHKRQGKNTFHSLDEEVDGAITNPVPNPAPHGDHGSNEHGEEFEMSEIVVHQVIHTIEFVLGAVSNTASYLRLWALSLAHAELASVFLEMILIATLAMCGSEDKNGGEYHKNNIQFLYIFVGFAIWAALTVAVLLMMESLSAFLHALRLHWVEFQNKFYLGDGYKFSPFSYEAILVEHGMTYAPDL